ncbi:hypothetical protein B9Z55_016058 [Caenorhabditis nigoni]|uniref:Uncharacterized protein n=1 Tax=Caenorhabditis nigoni TaxID=1611254 RepID=A0A2G5UD84_9PELO|nr:hypothetical protein B9Z55_016058 [Caenorhabditis nigoni]
MKTNIYIIRSVVVSLVFLNFLQKWNLVEFGSFRSLYSNQLCNNGSVLWRRLQSHLCDLQKWVSTIWHIKKRVNSKLKNPWPGGGRDENILSITTDLWCISTKRSRAERQRDKRSTQHILLWK